MFIRSAKYQHLMDSANNMNKFFFKKINIEKGFTLIELLVATSIFAIIAVGAVSVLLSSQIAYKRLADNRMAIDNINLVLNSMSQEIKFGTNYGCINASGNFASSSDYPSFASSTIFGDSVGTNCNALVFTPQGATTTKIVYYLDSDKATLNEADYNLSGGSYVRQVDFPITSPELFINSFWFTVTGTRNDDYIQPSVEIYVSSIVSLTKNKDRNVVATTTFAGQVLVSQRILDN